MPSAKRLFVVACEESADIHARSFIKALKKEHHHLQISGLGGQFMQEAGAELIMPPGYIGVTGITEIFSHIKILKKAYDAIKSHLKQHKPDLLVLIDCPGFNLRLAKYAKQTLGIRTLYYISPQIWAWKANRIHTIKQNIDRMAVIFPFEKQIYEQANVPVSFVGHPLADSIKTHYDEGAIRKQLNLPLNKRIISLLPGSRRHEIERHMPVMIKSAAMLCTQYDDLHFVIPLANSITTESIHTYLRGRTLPITLVRGKSVETAACSDYIVVASGTASLECALLHKPMCIIYKTSLSAFYIASKVMKVKYLGLCNLLQNRMTVPELLQYDCNPTSLTNVILQLMNDSSYRNTMETRLKHLKSSLSNQQADCRIDKLIATELNL